MKHTAFPTEKLPEIGWIERTIWTSGADCSPTAVWKNQIAKSQHSEISVVTSLDGINGLLIQTSLSAVDRGNKPKSGWEFRLLPLLPLSKSSPVMQIA